MCNLSMYVEDEGRIKATVDCLKGLEKISSLPLEEAMDCFDVPDYLRDAVVERYNKIYEN